MNSLALMVQIPPKQLWHQETVVPQGSVLGPFLFIIHYDFSTVQLTPGTKIYFYADDIFLYKKLKLTKITLPSKQTSILYVNGLRITI